MDNSTNTLLNASKKTFSQLGQERVNFPTEEEKVLQYWREIDAFKTQLEKSKGKKPYTFYDGPPFATGKPHYGHLLAGTIKDVMCRYATQTGHHVERRFGWDTHGLPVEYEIEKDLHINSREDVLKMGIAKYNAECRKIVMRCASDWEKTVERMGRWIDFKNDYKTLDKTFMESVWWVFKEMHKKDLLYRGYKVMPYSTALNTPLSNFEAKSNYQSRTDPAIVVTFPLVNDENTCLLAWTTTPWTLPSNLALCVNKNLTYVKVQSSENGKFYICGKETLPLVKKGLKNVTLKVVQELKGEELVGWRYVPIFRYFAHRKDNFRVVCDDFVGATEGTAIVHQAPGFGEDDFRVCEEHKICEKGEEVPCPIDHAGRFTSEIGDYAGVYVLDANKEIIKELKSKDRLWSQSTIVHEYPLCWRSETPLLYRAIPSWFIKVTEIKDQLLKNNAKTFWVPDNVKVKRFHNWLEQARDWAVSRNRYWGTPLPIWISEKGDEWEVIGSVAELEQRSGRKIEDLHREFIDDIVLKSLKTGKELRRVDEVFDCWFESGSMPYAQSHYPFAFKEPERFLKELFPGDFIAEGIDQTRGWFYTLLVISTALFDQPAWKNLIVNGLVLAEDGKKMSKRLKNYPEPDKIFDNYGADALRIYLCNSPAVRAENLNFSEAGVQSVIKDVLNPWWNAYKFFIENASRFERDKGIVFAYDENVHEKVTNVMDRWILSELQSLISFVRTEMEQYRLYTVVPELLRYIDKLCNWYVRMNRTRLRGQESSDDAMASLSTLCNVLLNLCQLMAPITPFVVESMYLNLRGALGENSEKSVHFLPIPQVNEKAIHKDIERRMRNMQTVIELGRNVRVTSRVKVKVPLTEAIIVNQDPQFLEDVKALVEYVKSELNCKDVKFSSELADYITLTAEPNHKELAVFKKKKQDITAALKTVKHEQLLELANTGVTRLCDEEIKSDMVTIVWNFTGDKEKYGAANDKGVLVLLNKQVSRELEMQGVSREVANRIQKLRKKGGVTPADLVTVYYTVEEQKSNVGEVLDVFKNEIEKITRVTIAPKYLKSDKIGVITEDTVEVEKEQLLLYLCKPQVYFQPGALDKYNEKIRDAIEQYVHSLDYATLKERYNKIDSKLSLHLDQQDITLVSGTDFVFDISMLNSKTGNKQPQTK